MKNILTLVIVIFLAVACDFDKSYDSFEIREYKAENQEAIRNQGQMNFVLDSMGAFSLRSLLDANIIPIKVYGTAFLMMEPNFETDNLTGENLAEGMKKYGFIRPSKIANWNTQLSPEPKINGSLGFVTSQIEESILGFRVSLEVGGITCAACHGSVTFDNRGNPTNEAWLGAGNSSLNYDGFIQQVYRGLKKGMLNSDQFILNIRKAYPQMSSLEERTIQKFILPKVKSAMKDYKEMDRVLPFPNGGPGHTNGVGSFKRNAKLLDNPFKYHDFEAGITEIPTLMDKTFRSSLLIDGAYAVKGEKRFEAIDRKRALDSKHLYQLSEMATFFTYAAMGVSLKNLEPQIPKVEKIFFNFLKTARPQKFPGVIEPIKASRGAILYKNACASCHGTYSEGIEEVRLETFPNKLIPQQEMGTDFFRWRSVDKSIADFADQTVFANHTNAGHTLGGYVAPVLTGVWFKAPYLHNGSVPTLWHLMNPDLRPKKFEVGGHALDLVQVGIKGQLDAQGDYRYDSDYKPWSKSDLFDTSGAGKSRRGHNQPFDSLTLEEKWDLIEYLKLL